jgi:hypothetical protein
VRTWHDTASRNHCRTPRRRQRTNVVDATTCTIHHNKPHYPPIGKSGSHHVDACSPNVLQAGLLQPLPASRGRHFSSHEEPTTRSQSTASGIYFIRGSTFSEWRLKKVPDAATCLQSFLRASHSGNICVASPMDLDDQIAALAVQPVRPRFQHRSAALAQHTRAGQALIALPLRCRSDGGWKPRVLSTFLSGGSAICL